MIGLLAGAIACAPLISSTIHTVWCVGIGIVVAVLFTMANRPARQAYVDNLMAGAALGLPIWGLVSVIAIPLFSGQMPEWGAHQMRTHFPALMGWVVYGALLGVLSQGFTDLAARLFGPEPAPPSPKPIPKRRIVILGGGFAGMKTAEYLEDQFHTDPSISITLVNETNALLFTPMLAEVAGSSLEPSHISTPLRSSLPRTEFIRATVAAVDFERRTVSLASEAAEGGEVPGGKRHIPYDQLVFALGAVSNYLGMANVEKLALNFKTLLDAIRVRNRVIEMFERADAAPHPEKRRPLLTFIIAGGGFAGVELAGALNDFARGILCDYPNVNAHDLQVILVHARDRILPELSESLGRYAQKRMEARGVIFRLNTRLSDVRPGTVILSDGEVPAETLVWTAGVAPSPLLKSLSLECDKRGAVIVEKTLAVKGHPGVWALGDCAAVVDARTGKPVPPTAQFALREAATLAQNIHAQLDGRSLEEFYFDSLGALCVVGHQTACAELSVPFTSGKSMRFSGLLAWFMWRTIYLGKLPGLERKIRVVVDWTVELFFPRDVVQTIDLK